MDYRLFSILFQEALECSSFEHYLSKHIHQEWMNDFLSIDKSDILNDIYHLAKMTLPDLYTSCQMSQEKFAISYDIPLQVVKEWCTGLTIVPNYIKMLIAYTFFNKQPSF